MSSMETDTATAVTPSFTSDTAAATVSGDAQAVPAAASAASAAAGDSSGAPSQQQQLGEQLEQCSVMAPPGASASVTVQLHPLVLLNVADHWTRLRAQQQGRDQRVFGALLGQQKGRNVEIMNSIELLCDTVDGHTVVDTDYYVMKEEQYKQVFPSMDLVGWYTDGCWPTAADVAVHRQICRLSESALLLLKLDPLAVEGLAGVGKAGSSAGELPVAVYESVVDVVSGATQMLMVPTGYTLATEEAERIGVDHVARLSTAGQGVSSALAESMVPQRGALQMLCRRVDIIARYVAAMHAGQVPLNYDILREASSISHCLPVVQSATFADELETQVSDVVLTAYLGALTKGCNTTLQFINKFNTMYQKQTLSRRVCGMF